MQHEVSEFIVFAPARLGKVIERAEPQLLTYLEGHFPHYRFRIEPFGPFAAEEGFSIVPIMNRLPLPGEPARHKSGMFICHLDPSVIPEILDVLGSFCPEPIRSVFH
jgi:hypothetical protein